MQLINNMPDIDIHCTMPAPKRILKENLPTKICPSCGLSFTWRKKWEKNWDNIKYCSEKCRSNK